MKNDHVEINIQPEAIHDPKVNTLYELKDGITKASWCNSDDAPGVVALGCGSGIILILPLDTHLLLEY